MKYPESYQMIEDKYDSLYRQITAQLYLESLLLMYLMN